MIKCAKNIDELNKEIKIATFNVSFGRNTFDELVMQMQITPKRQKNLIFSYLNNTAEQKNKNLAEKVIQICNVAAIIQKNRPNVLLLNEFNNDGSDGDNQALIGFQHNYLGVSQSLDGAGAKANLAPIFYAYSQSYATNTGLLSGLGIKNQLPDDAWGYGLYHGHYAFSLLSKYEIDEMNTRTFQQFKWKDMENASIPKATCHKNAKNPPLGIKQGENWYGLDEWQQIRLSSKNHVDVPIIIPTVKGKETIHFLISHPTPPVFDFGKNKMRNAAEVQFWHHYIQGKSYFYDDMGNKGGLVAGTKFILLGDQNLDPIAGDGISEIMQTLHDDPLLNQNVMNGPLFPISKGGAEYAGRRKFTHPSPKRITSTFGLTVDYVMPCALLNVINSGVYWPASYQQGRKLVFDSRIGKYGDGKNVSSDHRLVWITIKF